MDGLINNNKNNKSNNVRHTPSIFPMMLSR
jgi:hypothetical protein